MVKEFECNSDGHRVPIAKHRIELNDDETPLFHSALHNVSCRSKKCFSRGNWQCATIELHRGDTVRMGVIIYVRTEERHYFAVLRGLPNTKRRYRSWLISNPQNGWVYLQVIRCSIVLHARCEIRLLKSRDCPHWSLQDRFHTSPRTALLYAHAVWIIKRPRYVPRSSRRDTYDRWVALRAILCRWRIHFLQIDKRPHWRCATGIDCLEAGRSNADEQISVPISRVLPIVWAT